VTPLGLDRSRRGEDVWLGQKMLFFVVGAALGVAGMITGLQWIVWLAIAVLAVGLLLRIAGRRSAAARARREPDREPEPEQELEQESEEEAGASGPSEGI
jgi:membrane protein implicated in regulation of membrane protease activity